MDILRHSGVRAVLFFAALAIWLVSLGGIGVIALSGWEYAQDPAGNNLAGVIRFIIAPAIPGALLGGAGLLALGSSPFAAAAPRLRGVGWWSLGALVVGIALGFLLFGMYVGAIGMFVTLVGHLLVVLALVVAAVRDGRRPWEA